MAIRPVFVPRENIVGHLEEIEVNFKWHAGFAVSQKQLSIQSLHENAKSMGICKNPLEVSSKSPVELGVQLSAFNLKLILEGFPNKVVEVLFQGSKKFEGGGPYLDLFDHSPRDAKRDSRLKSSGNLESFLFGEFQWALEPKTAFYDWLYINALVSNRALAESVKEYDGFSDIEFNPKKSFNCQARSLALFLSIQSNVVFEKLISDPRAFEKFCYGRKTPSSNQGELF